MDVKKLWQSTFVKNTAILFAGTASAAAINIAFRTILARQYTPEDFGTLSLLVTLASIGAIMVTGRYEFGILNPKEDREAKGLLAIAIRSALFFSALLAAIIIPFQSMVAGWMQVSDQPHLVYLLPAATFFLAAVVSITEYSNRNKFYLTIATSRITQRVSEGGLQIGLAFLQPLYSNLLFGRILGDATAFFTILIRNRKKIGNAFTIPRSELKEIAKKNNSYPIKLLLPQTMASLYGKAPFIFIIWQYSSKELGFFAFASQMIAIPVTLLSRAVASVFRQEAAELYHSGKNFHSLYIKTIKNIALLGLIPFGALFFIAPEIFEWVFGVGWARSGFFVQIMVIAIYVGFFTSCIETTPIIVDNKRFIQNWHYSRFSFNAVLIFICWYFQLEIEYYIAGITFTRLLHYVIKLIYCNKFSKMSGNVV